MRLVALVLLVASSVSYAQQSTRGIGVYPGDPKEYAGPTLRVDSTYRNLALHRPAYQSSAYDYNLTAQLVTDGIKETALPGWIATSTSDAGELKKTQREVFLDGNVVSSVEVTGDAPWVEFDFEGGGAIPEIDRLDLSLRKLYRPLPSSGWKYLVLGSDDRATWTEVGRSEGTSWPNMREEGPSFSQTIAFAAPSHYRDYRVQVSADGIKKWEVAELVLFDKGQEVRVAGPERFASAWMSAGSGEEWVYVDLGAVCTFDRVVLDWARRAAEGAVQVSDDAVGWKTVVALSGTDDIHLAQPARGRYVRVLMSKPAEAGARYILSELEVYGRGGLLAVPKAAAVAKADGTLRLEGGDWRVQRASLVAGDGERISTPGFAAKDWLVATVPGTVLTSYLNAAALFRL